jgi:hypothetical protein
MAVGLIRLEIIANQTVEKEIRAILDDNGESRYTIIPQAYGRGIQEPREGTFVWPEVNFIAIVWAETAVIEKTETLLEELREKFPNEGIAYFR